MLADDMLCFGFLISHLLKFDAQDTIVWVKTGMQKMSLARDSSN
jgi:hypothetical protein